jgi:hypothetical protein
VGAHAGCAVCHWRAWGARTCGLGGCDAPDAEPDGIPSLLHTAEIAIRFSPGWTARGPRVRSGDEVSGARPVAAPRRGTRLLSGRGRMAIIPLWLGEARRRLMTGGASVPVQQGRPVLFEGLFQCPLLSPPTLSMLYGVCRVTGPVAKPRLRSVGASLAEPHLVPAVGT